MTRFSHRLLATLLASCCALAVGCSSGPGTIDEVEPYEWMDDPSAIRDTLAAVGMAKILGNKANARTRAEADARAKLAATARAQMQQLIANWAKETGDMLDDATVASYLNDETLIRQITDMELIGARAAKYAENDGYQYVLVVMDDPAEWTKRVGTSLRDKAIRDETLWKTEVMKRDFEAKLDKLINRDASRAAEATEELIDSSR